MIAAIRAVAKRQLASAAKISTRTIPATLAAANEMPDAKLRPPFEAASSVAAEKRKSHDSDEAMVQWLVQQVRDRGATVMAELLGYDEANLAKVIKGKRRLSGELRKRIGERIIRERN
jgi:hypothetical protein